jgi:microcystin degradation protein MlrC
LDDAVRIGIAGISHETNTYCAKPTPLDAFHIERGDGIVAWRAGTRTYIGGMLDAAASIGAEAVPLVAANANPSGVIEAAAYASMRDEILGAIRAAGTLDAIALDLHGAGIAEGVDDVEADLVWSIRKLVGPGVKLVASFDLHGNLTQRMADGLEAGFGVHFYPHTDMYERGHEAVSIVPALLDGSLRPVTHIEPLPILLPTSTTNRGPAARVNELCAVIEARPGVVDCTFFHGFPYCDVPFTGSSVYVATNEDAGFARACAQEVASFVWSIRDEFRRDVRSPAEAIEEALAIDGPVVINETSDNPGGGSPGDGTHLLRAMFEAGLADACFSYIADPEVAAQAHAAGVGATIAVRLGGKTDAMHGTPLDLEVTVRCLTDGVLTMQALAAGARLDIGRSARLQAGGIDVIVASIPFQTADPEIFLIHGMDVRRYKIVAVKSSQHFRAGFEPLAAAIVTADSPGLTTLCPEVFDRVRHARPLWPKHPEASYR